MLPEAKGARFTALLKSVHIRTQTKAAMELQPTEEDMTINRVCIDQAKMVFPDHDTVSQLSFQCHHFCLTSMLSV